MRPMMRMNVCLFGLVILASGWNEGSLSAGEPELSQFVRITGYGNSLNGWNSITEVSFPFPNPGIEIVEVTASQSDDNLPRNTIDGDLDTRFSAYGAGQWIAFEFSNSTELAAIQIAFHAGDERRSRIAIEGSIDGEKWNPLFLGESSGTTLGFETFAFSEHSKQILAALNERLEVLAKAVETLYQEMRLEFEDSPRNSYVRRHYGLIQWLRTELADHAIGRFELGVSFSIDEVEQIISALESGEDYLSSQRGELLWAHHSIPDDTGQPFILRVPRTYSPERSYPLLVELHGSGDRPRSGAKGEVSEDYIHVWPLARGDNQYEGVGGFTVMEMIDYLEEVFPIDSSRIELTGHSMGGKGTWTLGSRFPWRFASVAPFYGYGHDLDLENLRNVPILASHGMSDFVVPSDIGRYDLARLEKAGIDAQVLWYPGLGHSANRMIHPGLWQIAQVNRGRDYDFLFTTDHPKRGRMYWCEVVAFTDPHAKASVEAKIDLQGRIHLRLGNIAEARLRMKELPEGVCLDDLIVNGAKVDFPDLSEHTSMVYLTMVEKRVVATTEEPARKNPLYASGGAGNLYLGDPLLLVYGTLGSAEQTKALHHLAETLAGRCVPDRPMVEGRFPVCADVDLTAEDLSRCNLLLLGGAESNAFSRRIMPRLPVRLSSSQIFVENVPPLPREDTWYGCYHYNPEQPERVLYLLDLDALDGQSIETLEDRVDLLLPGMETKLPLANPDFQAVRGEQILRRLQYGQDWQWNTDASYRHLEPELFGDIEVLNRAQAKAMREATHSDFGLFALRSPAEKIRYDAEFFSWGDWATANWRTSALVVTASAAQMKEIVEKLVVTKRATLFPSWSGEDPFEMGKSYRLALYPEAFWIFRELNFNFLDVEPGAEIGPFLLLEAEPASAN